MYHANDAHIITTDDITGAKSLKLHERKGRKFLKAEVELNPEKEYTEEGLRLHLTNGVTHRYLMPADYVPEDVVSEDTAKENKQPKEEEEKHGAAAVMEKAKETVESVPEEVAGVLGSAHAARKQSDTKKG